MASRLRLIIGAAIIALLGLGGLFWIWQQSQTPDPVAETGEPAVVAPVDGDLRMVIEVAGEANGTVVIDLLEDVAPGHVTQIAALARQGAYNNVVFHRVIDGFMAQTGDVEFGVMGEDMRRAGQGGSDLPDLQAEFSDVPYERGIVGMARAQDPDSANSQFFIMFQPGYFLNGQYTVVGRVVEGMEIVDAIKRGDGPNGAVIGQPDMMKTVTIVD